MTRFSKEDMDRLFTDHAHIETRTIFIGDDDDDGGINSMVARNVIKAFHLLTNISYDPITIYINSFGGCWFNGMAIYDVIHHAPCEVTAYVLGSAMSMGSIILQAADKRIIYPNATIMVHDGHETVENQSPQTFVNWAEYTKKARNIMYRIYSQRSGKPVTFWRRKCSADLILTAHEAKSYGLVDEIYGE